MSLRTFVAREEELALLDSLWESPRASMLILYGRRRVGKTRLLTHWLTQYHPQSGIYWVAEPTSALDQLRSFSQALYNYATPDEPAPLDFTYANWEQAFRQVALLASSEKLVLFIDELGYLIEVNPALTGILQKSWDRWMSKSNVILALSGSQMGLMQRIFSYDAPLYGRATAQVKLPPLPFSATHEFFPNYNAKERILLYSIWGGVPAYWERLDPNLSILENVRRQFLSSNTLMQEEPRLLLQDFINDPYNYVGIMRAIAGGAVTNNRISTRTGLAKGHISKYLSVLRETGFVARSVPVTENPAQSRRGHYSITDPYLRFHYRFLSAYQAKLALGEQQQILNNIEINLSDFIEQNSWTELCREWLLRASTHGIVPHTIQQVGGAWHRNAQIDVAGINEEDRLLVVGDCHWQDEQATLAELETLINRTSSIIPKNSKQTWSVYFVSFAASGWTADALERASQMVERNGGGKNWRPIGVQLIDLERVDSDLASWKTAATQN